MADPAPDIRLPELTVVAPQTANDVTGDAFIIAKDAGEAKDPGNAVRPPDATFHVAASSIRDAEAGLINEGKTQVSAFESFKDFVVGEEKWVFLVSNANDMVKPEHQEYHFNQGGGYTTGEYFQDPNPGKTKEIIDGQRALLRACGDSIFAVGQFTAMLNDAAQYYAEADLNSYPPPT